jgi:ATP-dependent Clp protease ATP-binding subunit ClpA
MFERFTVPARQAVARAADEAARLGPGPVGTQHLLLGLLVPNAGVAAGVLHSKGLDAGQVRADIERLAGTPARVFDQEDAAALRSIGIDLDAVLARIEESFGPEALHRPAPTPKQETLWPRSRRTGRLTPRARKVLGLALREAVHRRDNYIGTEHLLLGLIREGDGLAARILVDNGIDLDDLRGAVLARLDQAA